MDGENFLQVSWKIIALTFRRFYDQLGLVIFLSVVWFILGFGSSVFALIMFLSQGNSINPFAIVLAPALIVFITGPVTAAIYAGVGRLIECNEMKIGELLADFRRYYWVAAKVSFAMLVIATVLLVDLLWFRRAGGFVHWLGYFWYYFLAFWAMMAMFVFPFVVNKGDRARQALKKAALIALDNILVSIVVLAVTLIFAYVSWRLRAPLVFLMAGFVAFLHQTAYGKLIVKYTD